ncbi:metal ABC transporter substrate-binding protein [Arcanobacterium pinnipediorum]|uniref:Metal ABC transporter substrate-binding protein n=1 Tax=Arcanobacterium pinnipediorum TaxID=1503041 RepID=A0ABY5AI42_9ACTO|nr:zinc ABC transporter substrate-binding protein [Arcanobacterium pinnipediorum]USR79530.1 metal ABC transporter substrate-binding protein [Arcanobacterium pinnipediorum]
MKAFSAIKLGFTTLIAGALLLSGCSSSTDEAKSTDNAGADKQLTVFATTGYLADAVANIAPDAEVITMVGPGGDPHTYQPTTKDIEALQNADVVLWNGLHLEAQMLDKLESLGDKQVAVGDALDEKYLLPWPETDEDGNELHDPHIWNSPEAWSEAVQVATDKIAEIDPDNAQTYQDNAKKYREEIKKTVAEAKALLDKVAPPRILISGHDAFNYFGQTFDLEVHATDFVSSEAKLSTQEISDLAKLIADNKVPAIFLDNLANPQAIKALEEAVKANGWEVKISDDELFADSLGAEKGVDTYLGSLMHNAEAVSKALGK